jgi:hypothetical protein
MMINLTDIRSVKSNIRLQTSKDMELSIRNQSNVKIDTSFTSNILFQVNDGMFPILFDTLLANLYIHVTRSHHMIS